MSKVIPARYSKSELSELQSLYVEFKNWHMDEVTDQLKYGAVAELLALPLLKAGFKYNEHITESHSLRCYQEWAMEMASDVARAIEAHNVEYFEELAVVMRAMKAGRDLKTITHKELKIKRRRGRASTESDLSIAFPLAIEEVIRKRCPKLARASRFTDKRITRKELINAIQHQQAKTGRLNPPPISETELSRWLGNFSFIANFIAEQPIARKHRRCAMK